jgi:hypothetical protein
MLLELDFKVLIMALLRGSLDLGQGRLPRGRGACLPHWRRWMVQQPQLKLREVFRVGLQGADYDALEGLLGQGHLPRRGDADYFILGDSPAREAFVHGDWICPTSFGILLAGEGTAPSLVGGAMEDPSTHSSRYGNIPSCPFLSITPPPSYIPLAVQVAQLRPRCSPTASRLQ